MYPSFCFFPVQFLIDAGPDPPYGLSVHPGDEVLVGAQLHQGFFWVDCIPHFGFERRHQ